MVEVFKNASMTIDRGDMIGIVGETGSGKSTLIDLILGLVEPSKGEILVDNQKIFQNKKDWNNLIGYVPQSVFLNDESLADNIYFYQLAEERNKEKLFNSIKQAQLIKFVENLP